MTRVMIARAGNAAFCAALSAQEQGSDVIVLERPPEDEAGGNSTFTAGAIRFAYDGVEDLCTLMPDITDQEAAQTDFGSYTEGQFFDDMGKITEYRYDPDLVTDAIQAALVRQGGTKLRSSASRGTGTPRNAATKILEVICHR